ncbi:pimeloyl-ACP methyl ester carboxylesterase [Arthrobacter stackebrandtii]|uniref:Pimeloyl-ACP methyl ester carboxylesterase n=1 Tax=Arthrobacter stackebrandtii TaxID=272161 RepID=A0ABS4Z125_9MICC|nr:alpha/beta fold hydrolase [Arthrobacter stackebrandtii]MBP2414659.1 pimeloyl-ACP methyl ester carboxylesterase [Arthrobacter stackebrandtii]
MVRGPVELSYVVGGSGPVVVFLHGLAGESGEFAPTMAALVGGFRVIALDQRGHGRSTRRPSDLSREAYVQDVVALIDHVSPGQPVHLVGQSMGAHTAMLVAAARPDLVASLAMLEVDAGSGSSDDAAALGRYFAGWPVPFASRSAAQAFLGESPVAGAWVSALERRDGGLWPRFDADIMESCIRAVGVPRWDEWAAVKARTLVIYAENGMFTEAQKTGFVGHRRGTLRIDLPNAGHDAHLDQCEPWTEALQAYLSESLVVCDR